jgi:hypothetical protein
VSGKHRNRLSDYAVLGWPDRGGRLLALVRLSVSAPLRAPLKASIADFGVRANRKSASSNVIGSAVAFLPIQIGL